MTLRRFTLLTLLVAFACGDDDRMPLDGGSSDGATDDARVDTVPPFVVATDPADEAEGVATDRPVVVFFSEPMRAEVGTASAAANGEAFTLGAGTWDESGRELRFAPVLPADATIEVSLEGLEDRAGNALVDYEFSFVTVDARAPRVTSATPAEGAEDVALAFEARFEVDEALASDRGAAALVGGTGVVGTPRFESGVLVVPVSELVADTRYALVLSDFADPSGNLLDGGEVLGDGPSTSPPRRTTPGPGSSTRPRGRAPSTCPSPPSSPPSASPSRWRAPARFGSRASSSPRAGAPRLGSWCGCLRPSSSRRRCGSS